MRRILLLCLMLMLPILTQAQAARFECESGERFDMQMEISAPFITEDSFAEYIVTVIGLDDFNPVLAIDAPEISKFCNIGFEEDTFYRLTLPDTPTIPEIVNNTQDFVSIAGDNDIQIGSENNEAGDFLVVIEGNLSLDTVMNDTFMLELTDEMLSSDVAPMVYLFALTEDFAPTLTVTSGVDDTVDAELIEEAIQMESDFGLTETAFAASLGETAGSVALSIDSNDTEGIYALVIHVKTGESAPGDGVAQVTDNEDGSLTLSCGGNVFSENATRIVLPDDGETYTVTAVGLVSLDPMMAIVDNNGNGTCYNDTESALSYAANLPTITVDASIYTAQVVADGDNRNVVVGSSGDDSGEYVIIVEGGAVATDEADTFGVYITPAMINVNDVITTYVIAADVSLNPILSYVTRIGEVITDDEDVPYQCDDAGIPDTCYGDTTALRDYHLTLADNAMLSALEVDAFLQLPIHEALTGATFELQITANNETSGAYVFVVHVVTE